MKKPHEEEWEQDAQYVDVIGGRDGVLKSMNKGDGMEFERARLASKAPKMARALMSLIEAFPPAGSEEEDEALEFARKVLREAGVLE